VLHLASRNGHVDLGWMLIDRGADMSAQTKDGSTALHLASLNGHVDFAQMLESSTGLAPHGIATT
jgi:ankyrin repeat protein